MVDKVLVRARRKSLCAFVWSCVRVWVRACMWVCVRVCMHTFVPVCVRDYVWWRMHKCGIREEFCVMM